MNGKIGIAWCMALAAAVLGTGALWADGAGGGEAVDFAPPALVWSSTVFGQSTTAKDNSVEIRPDGSVVIASLNGKGKVTGAQDGIAYYYAAFDPSAYNFSLSANIEVLTFANDGDPSKPKPNNQEAFGLMIRDAIGASGDSTVFASNMVYTGGYRGQLQAVMREGVEESSGAGAKMSSAPLDAKFPGKGSVFRLEIRKTNTGYHVVLNDDPESEKIFYRPSLMKVQDKTRLYAGFFAARNASIKVTNIRLSFSDPKSDPQAIPEPPKPLAPELGVLSPLEAPPGDYNLIVSANVDGVLAAARAGTPVFSDVRVAAGEEFVATLPLAAGENPVDFRFVPDNGQHVTSTAAISRQVKIIVKSFGDLSAPLQVSPAGKPEGDGTAAKPLDIYTAVKYLRPGQGIALADGVYKLTSPLIIQRGNDGAPSAPKRIAGSGSAKAVLSFENSAPGFQVLGDWWIVSDISVAKSTSTGLRLAGHHNTVERCVAFSNANTGIQISGGSLDPKERWPSFNLVSGCVSHDNKDPAESDADGFAAKLTVGEGNSFRNCVARNNCDDGWDLYTKLETGPIGSVKIERCVAYRNGVMSDGTPTKGDGNGFKLGGEGISVVHEIADCYSFANKACGFTSNSNPSVTIRNAVSADNGGPNFAFDVYSQASPAFELSSLYSVRTTAGPADRYASILPGDSVYLFDGAAAKNGKGEILAPGAFASVQQPAMVSPGVERPEMGGYLEPAR